MKFNVNKKLNTAILLTSGATVTWAHHGIVAGAKKSSQIGLLLTIVLAIIFTALAIIFSALPLDTIAFLPIGLAMIFCLLLLKKSAVNQKKLPNILLLLCVVSSLFVLGKSLLVKDQVLLA